MRSAKWTLKKWVTLLKVERRHTQQGCPKAGKLRPVHRTTPNLPCVASCSDLRLWGQRDAEVQDHDGHFLTDLGIYLWKETQKQASSPQVWLPSHLPPISMNPLLTGGKWVVQNKDPQRCHSPFKLHGKGELRHQVGWTLKQKFSWIIPGDPSWSQGLFKHGERCQKSQGQSDRMGQRHNWPLLVLKGRRSHKPWNIGRLQELERAGQQILL